MCNVKRLHILFKQKYNKLDSNHNKDFPSAFIDDFLYEAALDYVDIFGASDQKKLKNMVLKLHNKELICYQLLLLI